MTNISIYDVTAKQIEDIAEKNDTTAAEIIETLVLDYIDEAKKDNGWEWKISFIGGDKMENKLYGHDLVNNLVHELNYLVSFVRDTNADVLDDAIELKQILEDASKDMDRYYDYADSIDVLLVDLEIED